MLFCHAHHKADSAEKLDVKNMRSINCLYSIHTNRKSFSNICDNKININSLSN